MASNDDEGVGTPRQGAAKVKTPLALRIKSTQLCILKSSYDNHFARYCKGRKKTTQLLPKMVWQRVYNDFIQYCSDELAGYGEKAAGFSIADLDLNAEATLKKSLLLAIKQTDTGRSDAKNSDTASLQQDEVLQALKRTDDHSRRLMMEKRSAALSSASSQAEPNNCSDSHVAKAKVLSKAEMMRKSVDALDVIANGLSSSANRISETMAQELEVSRGRSKLVSEELEESKKRTKMVRESHELNAKRLKMDEDRLAMDKENDKERLIMSKVQAQLSTLKMLKDTGVLDVLEFKRRSLELSAKLLSE
jgi:hypothetical protein